MVPFANNCQRLAHMYFKTWIHEAFVLLFSSFLLFPLLWFVHVHYYDTQAPSAVQSPFAIRHSTHVHYRFLIQPLALETPLMFLVYFHKWRYLGPCRLASHPRDLTGGFRLCTRV